MGHLGVAGVGMHSGWLRCTVAGIEMHSGWYSSITSTDCESRGGRQVGLETER